MSIWQLLFSFEGRVRRLHWWLVRFGVGLTFLVLFLAAGVIGAIVKAGPGYPREGGVDLMVGLAVIFALPVMLWIEVAITAKRWHDRDKPAAMVLIAFIPLIGGLWTLVECGFLEGTAGSNRYGASPKGLSLEQVFS